MSAAALERPQPFRDARGEGAIVFDPARLRQANPGLFEAAGYGARATPVSAAGGRGSAWFVEGEFGHAVLRHYRRGGWMARLSDRSFVWLGESRVRSLREFALTSRLHAAGLPVAAPIAAMYARHGYAYRAAILVERIQDVRPFVDCVNALGAGAPWAEVGATVARLHRRGARHADLNGHNILVDAGGRSWVIDWDKGRLEDAAGGWCSGVLERLARSLRKHRGNLPQGVLEEGLRRLRHAHDKALAS